MNCDMSMDAILSWMNLHMLSMFAGFVFYKCNSPELEEAFLIKDLIIYSISILQSSWYFTYR